MLSYYVPSNLLRDVYPYMTWDTLYYYNDVPEIIWEHWYKNVKFTKKWGSARYHTNIFCNYKEWVLDNEIYYYRRYPEYIPCHLWSDVNFIRRCIRIQRNGTILQYIPDNLKNKRT